jgi:iron complex outermembrane receptor protein
MYLKSNVQAVLILFICCSSLLAQDIDDVLFLDPDQVLGASKYEQQISQAPAAITVITAEEIENYGYETLGEILESVPGFYYFHNRRNGVLGVRGFPRQTGYVQHVLILMDGQPMNDGVTGGTELDEAAVLDISQIERLEIIRGPGSSLYGANAFLAVVNILTKRGRDIQGFEGALEYGSFEKKRARVTLGDKLDARREWLVAASFFDTEGDDRLYYSDFDRPETNNGIVEDFANVESHSVRFKYRHGEWQLSGGHRSREQDLPSIPPRVVFNGGMSLADYQNTYTQLSFSHLMDRSEIKFQAGWSQAEESLSFLLVPGRQIPPGTINTTSWKGNRLNVQGEWIKRWDQFTLISGVEGTRQSDIELGNVIEGLAVLHDSEWDIDSFALFMQGEWVKGPWTLNLGARYDDYETFGSNLAPRLAFIRRLPGEGSLKLLYGEAFRAPNAIENYFETSAGLLPNRNLTPEQIQSYELVWEQILYGKLKSRFSVFRNSVEDLISLEFLPDIEAFIQENNQNFRIEGVEAEFHAQFDVGVSTFAGYTYQRDREFHTGPPRSNAPKHLAKAGFRYRNSDANWGFSSTWSHYGSRLTLRQQTLGAETIGRARAFFKPRKNMTIALVVDNLLDREVLQPSSSDIAQDALLMDGRTYRLTFSIGR